MTKKMEKQIFCIKVKDRNSANFSSILMVDTSTGFVDLKLFWPHDKQLLVCRQKNLTETKLNLTDLEIKSKKTNCFDLMKIFWEHKN